MRVEEKSSSPGSQPVPVIITAQKTLGFIDELAGKPVVVLNSASKKPNLATIAVS